MNFIGIRGQHFGLFEFFQRPLVKLHRHVGPSHSHQRFRFFRKMGVPAREGDQRLVVPFLKKVGPGQKPDGLWIFRGFHQGFFQIVLRHFELVGLELLKGELEIQCGLGRADFRVNDDGRFLKPLVRAGLWQGWRGGPLLGWRRGLFEPLVGRNLSLGRRPRRTSRTRQARQQ